VRSHLRRNRLRVFGALLILKVRRCWTLTQGPDQSQQSVCCYRT
jgi:hypothetical protein